MGHYCASWAQLSLGLFDIPMYQPRQASISISCQISSITFVGGFFLGSISNTVIHILLISGHVITCKAQSCLSSNCPIVIAIRKLSGFWTLKNYSTRNMLWVLWYWKCLCRLQGILLIYLLISVWICVTWSSKQAFSLPLVAGVATSSVWVSHRLKSDLILNTRI